MATPLLTVILWSRGDHAPLRRCIESLRAAHGGAALEIIAAVYPPMKQAPQGALLITAKQPENHAVLRAMALQQAHGEWLFFTEPHCTFPQDFVGRLVEATRSGQSIVGGSVTVAEGTSLVGWASVFFEFGAFLLPAKSAEHVGVTTNNVLISRPLLEPMSQWMPRGFWKFFFLEEAVAAGTRLLQQPDRAVLHHPPYTLAGFLVRTFHHARVFAVMRNRGAGLVARFARALCFPFVPPMMLARCVATCWPKRMSRGKLVACLPLLLLIYCSWALGEAIGLVSGEGGSREKVY